MPSETTIIHYINSNLTPIHFNLQLSLSKIFLQQLKIPQVSADHLQLLNAPFTYTEITKVAYSMPSNKFPGLDGITGEYYKTFNHILSPHLEKIYNTASASAFPPEMLKVLIVTLPKPKFPLYISPE